MSSTIDGSQIEVGDGEALLLWSMVAKSVTKIVIIKIFNLDCILMEICKSVKVKVCG